MVDARLFSRPEFGEITNHMEFYAALIASGIDDQDVPLPGNLREHLVEYRKLRAKLHDLIVAAETATPRS
jgi:hypothetical protein